MLFNQTKGKEFMQTSIISKTLKIKSPKLPPEVDFIIQEIRKQNLEPLRWAIVEVQDNEITLSVSGYEI